ncbi:enoyl-CoA hydratase/isomerase family protein [Phenylobacterium sp.]|uniref:enoyl-CoA hydratase/isomerase family protein n=1 Tax=Phenylobacterium sp. TaxID=1871053 RepID=UPI00262AB6EF|nr:enoyl-CoA hydratase/isomerase family protein [Phenylobacterium sp.]
MAEDRLFDESWRTVRVTRNGPVVEVALHRPDARNALDSTLMDELTEIARLLRLRPDVLAVTLTGADSYFSAGADLRSSGERTAQPTLMEARRAVMRGPDLCQAWEAIELVTIAAIEGYCLGGACALVAACDFRIMGRSAYVRLPEIPLGINMSWRTLPRLVSLIGPARAKRFVMFGEPADAAACEAWGMCDEVVDDGRALAAARGWAAKIVKLPPLPVRMTKEAITAIAAANHHASIYMDRDQFLLATRSHDYREGVTAFFEKREPEFRGD